MILVAGKAVSRNPLVRIYTLAHNLYGTLFSRYPIIFFSNQIHA